MCLGTSSKDNKILFLLVKDVVINKGTYLNVIKYCILINAYNAIYIYFIIIKNMKTNAFAGNNIGVNFEIIY